MTFASEPSTPQLAHALSLVGDMIERIEDLQWSAPTSCTDWSVHDLVNHLVGMNLVFVALVTEEAPLELVGDHLGNDPVGVYRSSSSVLVASFEKSGVLEQDFVGPLGSATGRDRLQIRLYDLLAHGWDLGQATGQSVRFLDDVVEQALAFALVQLSEKPRTGRFEPATIISEEVPAIDWLVAFLGRSVSPAERASRS